MMPHIIVKIWPGRTEQEKSSLTHALLNAVKETVGCQSDAVSIAIEEVPQKDWFEKVYYPEIEGKKDNLYKKPGYSPPR
jgi:4-oxalocrotonate tautomerase